MTLYAPHSKNQALGIIARRALSGKPALLAISLTAFAAFAASSGYSKYDIRAEATLPDVSYDTLPRGLTSLAAVAPVNPIVLSDSLISAGAGVSSAIAPIALSSEHPTFIARPLPDETLSDHALFGGEKSKTTQEPQVQLRLANLSLPGIDRSDLDGLALPRLPDVASVDIIPPELTKQTSRDSSLGTIDHDPISEARSRQRVESVRAIGGETLESLLSEFQIDEDDRHATLVALRADNISNRLSEDDQIDLAFEENRKMGTNHLIGMRLRMKAGREVELRWDGEIYDLWQPLADQVVSEEQYRPVSTIEALGERATQFGERERVFLQGIIKSSLYDAADDAGMTPGEAKTLTDMFRYLIDFERDLRVGDRFEVLFEKKDNGDYGDILYAMIENRGNQVTLYRGPSELGDFEYYDAEGKTNKRSLMRTPLAYSRISSKFGMRRHPVDGYRKLHKGVDFAARRGTPIVAAGNGVVSYVGRRGSYGKYIRLKHNGTYSTAYAHLSRYKTGLANGQRVKQGEVIGYVGSTGKSTGAHLHFEVLENGKRVNPMKVGDFGPIRSLSGSELAQFKAGIARTNLVIAEIRPQTVVAQQ